jgi:hypothetical protein
MHKGLNAGLLEREREREREMKKEVMKGTKKEKSWKEKEIC